MEEELGQSPARVAAALVTTLYTVMPAKAGIQLSCRETGRKLDPGLRRGDGIWCGNVIHHQHWKRSDFKSGGDIG
ncbi:MAG: hypothetical protein ABIN69_10105 [Aestuariivirga sp.]